MCTLSLSLVNSSPYNGARNHRLSSQTNCETFTKDEQLKLLTQSKNLQRPSHSHVYCLLYLVKPFGCDSVVRDEQKDRNWRLVFGKLWYFVCSFHCRARFDQFTTALQSLTHSLKRCNGEYIANGTLCHPLSITKQSFISHFMTNRTDFGVSTLCQFCY